jgi:hypothetical protein
LVAVTSTAISLITVSTASTSTPSASSTSTTAIFDLHVVAIRRRWFHAFGEGAREGWSTGAATGMLNRAAAMRCWLRADRI